MVSYVETGVKRGVLRGFLHEPKDSVGLVFIQHGYFSSNHLGPNRMYWSIAESLCGIGLSVYRFSSYGFGDSDGQISEADYDEQVDDWISVVSDFAVAGKKLFFVGHSMGTSVSLRLSVLFKPTMVALISPSIGRINNPEFLFDSLQMEELETAGWTRRKGLEISNKFMKRSQADDIFLTMGQVRQAGISIGMFYGLEDQLYQLKTIQQIQPLLNSSLYTYCDADHNFIELLARERMIKDLVGQFNLKLNS